MSVIVLLLARRVSHGGSLAPDLMRILHVIPGLTRERGGPSAVIEALTRHQATAGHSVAVLTTDQGQRHGEQPTELDSRVHLERARVRGPDRVAYAPRLAGIARRLVHESDVVHVHSIFTHPIHVALREANGAGIPAILRPCGQLHAYSLRRSRAWKRTYLALWGNRVRRAVAAWHYTSEQEATESWPGDDSHRFVLPNGIEPEEYAIDRMAARTAVSQTWPAIGESPYVLFLGRLHPKKRVDLLVEAFLDGAPAGWRLVIAGPDEAGLWAPIASRLLNDQTSSRVVRLDTVGGKNKVALLACAALFALPSEHENFGIAALESLAAGTPVLLSPHVDLAESARAAGIGFIAPAKRDAWRIRLTALLSDRGALSMLAQPAQTWVANHYAWDRISAALLERYRWAIQGCPTAVGRVESARPTGALVGLADSVHPPE
jgi:glycosyltransferase involved in cell wall biosynthesis